MSQRRQRPTTGNDLDVQAIRLLLDQVEAPEFRGRMQKYGDRHPGVVDRLAVILEWRAKNPGQTTIPQSQIEIDEKQVEAMREALALCTPPGYVKGKDWDLPTASFRIVSIVDRRVRTDGSPLADAANTSALGFGRQDNSAPTGPSAEAVKPKFRSIGHSNNINAVLMRVEGDFLSASADGSIRAWDTNTGGQKFVMQGHTAPVNHVCVSSSSRIISASADATVRIWVSKNGAPLAILTGHTAPVNFVIPAFNNVVIAASADGSLGVWRLDNYRPIAQLRHHREPVNHLAMVVDGQVVSASADGTIAIWNLDDPEPIRILEGHDGPVNFVLPTEADEIISASADGTVRIWSADTGSCLRVLHGHKRNSPVNRVAFTSKQDVVISACNDRTLRMWRLDTGEQIGALVGHHGKVNDVVVTPDDLCISASSDGTLRVWDIRSAQCAFVLHGHDSVVTRVALDVGRRRLVSGSFDASVIGWDITQAAHLRAKSAANRAP